MGRQDTGEGHRGLSLEKTSQVTQHHHPHSIAMDGAAIIMILGSFSGYLPYIASSFAILWYCVLFYDRVFHGRSGPDGE
jgi:hypothetical protein